MAGYLEYLMNPASQGALYGIDPSTAGLMSASAALLRGSGPSALPRSFGQNLGEGMLAGLGGFQGAQQNALQQRLLAAHGALYEQQVRKAQLDNDLNQQLMTGNALGKFNDPDWLDMMATKAVLGGHPGAPTLVSQADKRRQLLDQQATINSFRSSPGILGAGVTMNSPQ